MRRNATALGRALASAGALLLALTPAAAGAQSLNQGLALARLETSLDSATLDSVRALLDKALQRKLPTDPLIAKALEGVEKGADGARIRAAVRALLARLEAASDALRPSVSVSELAAGADALQVGVPPESLREIRKLSPRRTTAVALGVLTQLVWRGVPPDKATAAVLTLLRRGSGPQQLLALDREVNSDIAVGMHPDAALELRKQAIIAALPAAPAGAAAAAAGDANAETFTNRGGGTPAATSGKKP